MDRSMISFFFAFFRLSMVETGSLMISEVLPNDAGKYECSAQSMAGTKTAPAAMLKVLAPPTIERGPHDTEIIEGEGLDWACQVSVMISKRSSSLTTSQSRPEH
jgi:Immunoglobulin I-set domain